jgi:hypothetical protein
MSSKEGRGSGMLVVATGIPLVIIWVILAATRALPWETLLSIAIAIVVLVLITVLRYRHQMRG